VRLRAPASKIVAMAVLLAGCHRGPNVAAVAGVRVTSAGYEPGSERASGESNAGFLGEVGGSAREYDLRDGISTRGAGDLYVGGNTSGPAAQLRLELAVGPALELGSEEHALFTRAAFAFDLERNPYSGNLSLELPTLEAGYVFHGSDDGHVEVYARGGLATAGSAYARAAAAPFLAAPEVGVAVAAFGPLAAAEASYTRVFEGPSLDVVRALGCLGWGLVVCGDARVTHATYVDEAGAERELTGYYGGVTFGVGVVWGRE
jgi:hypothetical protein